VVLTNPIERAFADAYGVPLATIEDIPGCEVLFRRFGPGAFPARPLLPYVIDFVVFPSLASTQADTVIGQFKDEPPTTYPAYPDPRQVVVRRAQIQPIPPEVYETNPYKTKRHAVVFLGLDTLGRTAGIVSAIQDAPPKVEGAAESSQNANITSHVFALPEYVKPGDLLVVAAAFAGNPTVTWPAGWTSLLEVNNGTGIQLDAAWRVADGTEQREALITTSSGVRSAHVCYLISNAATPPEFASSTGSSIAPNPPSLAPSGGTNPYLWLIAEANVASGANRPVTAYPSGYLSGISAMSDSAVVAAASRGLQAATEDPGAFTLASSAAWVAATIAVAPALTYTAEGVVIPGGTVGAGVTEAFRYWEKLRTADVALVTLGAGHQACSAMGVLEAAVTTTTAEHLQVVDGFRTPVPVENSLYLGPLDSLTDAQIGQVVRSLMDDDDSYAPYSACLTGRRGLRVAMKHAGWFNFSETNSLRICMWIVNYLVGTRDTPFLVRGYDSLIPSRSNRFLPPTGRPGVPPAFATVIGTVIDPVAGNPVAGAIVLVCQGSAGMIQDGTGADGKFSVPVFAAGSYILKSSKIEVGSRSTPFTVVSQDEVVDLGLVVLDQPYAAPSCP
jgi:hypothetical protein